jgi:hypothetical protein
MSPANLSCAGPKPGGDQQPNNPCRVTPCSATSQSCHTPELPLQISLHTRHTAHNPTNEQLCADSPAQLCWALSAHSACGHNPLQGQAGQWCVTCAVTPLTTAAHPPPNGHLFLAGTHTSTSTCTCASTCQGLGAPPAKLRVHTWGRSVTPTTPAPSPQQHTQDCSCWCCSACPAHPTLTATTTPAQTHTQRTPCPPPPNRCCHPE